MNVARFVKHLPAVADRPGINPFTKEPLVLKGAPARIAFADIDVTGTSVTEIWGELDAASGARLEQNDGETRSFATVEDAERRVKEHALRLREQGFDELAIEEAGS